MVWVAFVLVWFGGTVLRGRRARFASGALFSGFALLAMLNAANPEGLITRVNVAAYARTGRLDAAYLGRLSADAVPSIVAAWPALPPEAKCSLSHRLAPANRDWRAWTVSRWRARRAVEKSGLELPAICPAAGS